MAMPVQVENDILGHLTMDMFLSKTGSGNLGCYRITMAKAIISFPFKQRQGSEPPSDRVVNCHYWVGNRSLQLRLPVFTIYSS